MTMMPMHTSMNAKSVPMFVRSTISSMLAKALTTPTSTPVRIVDTWGVPKRGCTRAKTGGSSPSRAIAKRIRGCPSWKTRSTAVCATTEPSATTPTVQLGICDVLHRDRERLGALARGRAVTSAG